MKKILGVLLSLIIISSMVVLPVNATTTATDNGLDITEIPGGQQFFTENFDASSSAVGDLITKNTSAFTDVANAVDYNLRNANYVVATDPVNGGTNKVMRTKSHLTMIHYSDELLALLKASDKTLTIKGKSYKYIDYDFDGDGSVDDEEYVLTYYNAQDLYWVKKSLIGTNISTSNIRTDLGYWFYINDDGSIKSVFEGGSNAASMTFPKPSTNELIGEVAYQFDFYYPESDYAFSGEEGFNFRFDEGIQFYVRDDGIKCLDTPSIVTGKTTSEPKSTQIITAAIPKGAESATPYFIPTADYDKYLTTTTMAKGGEWHTIMIKMDVVSNQYTFYFDGKPVYFPTASGYGCKINRADGYSGVPAISLLTQRLCVYADREPYFDNFKGYYTEHVVDGIDITELSGGTKYFGQNFDDANITEGDRVTAAMGFRSVEDTKTNANVRYYVGRDTVTDVPETSNRVLQLVPEKTMLRATDAQYQALQDSKTTVLWGSKTYKVIDFVDGYYIASQATTKNTALYWINKSSVTDGVLKASPVQNTDYGPWFIVDSNGVAKDVSLASSGVSLQLPAPSEGVKGYAYQLDFAYPENGNLYCGEEGFDIQVEGNQYHVRSGGIRRSGDGYPTRMLDFGDAGTVVEDSRTHTNAMVPKVSVDIPHYFSADDYASQLTQLSPMYADGSWHTFMVYFNLEEAYFTLYFDGLPIYAKASNGGYSCRYKLDDPKSAAITVTTNRYCVYNDHTPMFDNYLAYEFLGTDDEIAERILSGLKLPYINDFEVIAGDIIFDEKESELVSWSFSNNAMVIDAANPLIARYNAPFGEGETKVTLTATCKYGTATKTRDFELTVKNRTKYEVDTVLMKDKDGNRIYRPLDNSVIESVSYTANTTDAAEMFLAVYGADGRLVNATKAVAENGKCTFNQPINADETYKVFLWENNTVTPLSEAKTDEYVESENPTIFVIGDSIAQTYGETSAMRGWGQYLSKAFNSNVTVDNDRGRGGRTTKWALVEDSLKYVLDNSKPGDYLFVMLGHNDQKSKGSADYVATTEEYKMILMGMINAAKAKGVETVILTSLARPSWDANGVAKDSHGIYPETAMAAAEATGAAVIDIDSISRAELTRLGKDEITRLGYYVSGDTHTTSVGADWVVGMIADELAKMNLPISQYLK